MSGGLRINPVSVIVFAAAGVWVYFYSKDKAWLLMRRLRRTPARLAILCAILPLPFLFIFLLDVFQHAGTQKTQAGSPPVSGIDGPPN